MELSRNPWSQVVDNTSKPKTVSFFPLQKLKGNQPISKMAAMCLEHFKEENAEGDEEVESENLDIINRVTEEFMLCLARAMKDTQVEEKCCYHCSSPKHFIHNCLLVRASKDNAQLNHKEGAASRKGVWTPQMKAAMPKNPQEEVPKTYQDLSKLPS